VAGLIAAGQIAAGQIAAGQIAAGQIAAGQIAAGQCCRSPGGSPAAGAATASSQRWPNWHVACAIRVGDSPPDKPDAAAELVASRVTLRVAAGAME
jgi:hypothetical protein